MTRATSKSLPIDASLPELRASLRSCHRLVLVAEPGAGKTTVVPTALLAEDWLGGRQIWMLEPRRLAAQAAARRLAQNLGEKAVGGRVGLLTREHRQISGRSQIVVMTEGVLTQRLQNDPELAEAAIVIFDEFHERSLHADLGLALCREVQGSLRPDLRLLLMSATLDEEALCQELAAPLLQCPGRCHPLTIRHRSMTLRQALDGGLNKLLREILARPGGSVLVFLPGEGEIRRAAQSLSQLSVPVHPLYARLDADAQLLALQSTERRVVLATAVAETSLTIDGLDTVIDCGWARYQEYDPVAGYGRLVTRRLSRMQAEQRAGRAGRTQPGCVWRLWSDEELLAPAVAPEIRRADLSALVMELARWGSFDLPWLEPPHAGRLAQALELNRELGLLDSAGALTRLGAAVARWPLEPRWGLLLQAAAEAPADIRAELIRLLSLLQNLHNLPVDEICVQDLASRWAARRLPSGQLRSLDAECQRWTRRLQATAAEAGPGVLPALADLSTEGALAVCCALAFPDRVAQRRGSPGRFRLSGGGGAALPEQHALAQEEFLLVLDLSGGREGRIRRALPISQPLLDRALGERMREQQLLEYDKSVQRVLSQVQTRLGQLPLSTRHWPDAPADAVASALLEGVRNQWQQLPWNQAHRQLCARVAFLRRHDQALPDCGEAALRQEAEDWLLPFLSGKNALADIDPACLQQGLEYRLAEYMTLLKRMTPARVAIGGREYALDYEPENAPILAAKLQDFLGQESGPSIMQGQHPVCLHLLSPARRPLAITRDLSSFWQQAWPQVRAQMRGRYPKHLWPENPRLPPSKNPRR